MNVDSLILSKPIAFKTDDCLDYSNFQEVASRYPEIPLREFKKASKLIETDRGIYSGLDSATSTQKILFGRNGIKDISGLLLCVIADITLSVRIDLLCLI